VNVEPANGKADDEDDLCGSAFHAGLLSALINFDVGPYTSGICVGFLRSPFAAAAVANQSGQILSAAKKPESEISRLEDPSCHWIVTLLSFDCYHAREE
jgi:hypothetical protein